MKRVAGKARRSVLIGSHHQGDRRYNAFAGKQHASNVLSYFCYMKYCPPERMTSASIDQILATGNVLHSMIYTSLRQDYLHTLDLPRKFVVDGYNYVVHMSPSRKGSVNSSDGPSTALSWAFAASNQAFFMCQGTVLGLKQIANKYYLFNPDSNSPSGKPNSDGSACLIQFDSLPVLSQYIQVHYSKASKQYFEIVPCKIDTAKASKQISSHVYPNSIPSLKSKKIIDRAIVRPPQQRSGLGNYPRLSTGRPSYPRTDVTPKAIGQSIRIEAENDVAHSQVLSGSFHQGDERFSPNSGKQCVANVLAFFCKSYGKPLGKMTRRGLDNTLNFGNALYGNITQHVQEDYLHTDELPREFTIDGIQYNIQINDSRNGQLGIKRKTIAALCWGFAGSNTVFFICQGKCIGLKFDDGIYYFFDSHSNSTEGLPAADGAACLVKFNSFDQLHNHIESYYRHQQNGFFEIIPCLINSVGKNGTVPCSINAMSIPRVASQHVIFHRQTDAVASLNNTALSSDERVCVISETVSCDTVTTPPPGFNQGPATFDKQPRLNHAHNTRCVTDGRFTTVECPNIDKPPPTLNLTQQENTSLIRHTRKQMPLFKSSPKQKVINVGGTSHKRKSSARSNNSNKNKTPAGNFLSDQTKPAKSKRGLIQKDTQTANDQLAESIALSPPRKKKRITRSIIVTDILTESQPNNAKTTPKSPHDTESTTELTNDSSWVDPLIGNDIDGSDSNFSDLHQFVSEAAMVEAPRVIESQTEHSTNDYSFAMKVMNEGPHYVCCICYTLRFRRGVTQIRDCKIPEIARYLRADYAQAQTLFMCHTCKRYIDKKQVPKFSYLNGMKMPAQPEELQITPEEEKLISLRLPFMQLKVLPSGFQMHQMGNVINVPTDISSTIRQLPRYINSAGTVCVRIKRRLRYKSVYRKFNVMPQKVLLALEYLLKTSDIYKEANVTINRTWLDDTIKFLTDGAQVDSQIMSRMEAKQSSSIVDSIDIGVPDNVPHKGSDSEDDNSDNFSEVDSNEVRDCLNTLMDGHDGVPYLDVAPGENHRPLNIAFDTNSEEMAFPSIYCGRRIEDSFPPKVSFIERSRWELISDNRRVAQNSELIFFKYKKYQMLFIYKNASFALRYIKGGRNYTAADVVSDSQRQNLSGLDNGYFVYRQLRNSPQYLQQKKRELFAMIRQMGIPTYFVSLSCADTHWFGLLRSLGKIVDHKEYSDEELQSMTYLEKCRLVNSDPTTCCRFFDNRFHEFLNKVLYHNSQPIGPVVDHFYRIEFQHRGSPHVHMLIYCQDSPVFKRGKDTSQVCKFVDKFISCSLEVTAEQAPFVKLQMHRHSATCRKGGRAVCRFHYPIPPFPETVILEPNKEATSADKKNYGHIQKYADKVVSDEVTFEKMLDDLELSLDDYVKAVRSSLKTPKVFLKRRPCEARVNMYMRNAVHVWQANMDCQFCLDPYTVVVYIANYINKQSRGLSLGLSEVMKENRKNQVDLNKSIKALGNVFLNSAELSVQEACYMLLGLPLAYMSRDVMTICTREIHDRARVVKDSSVLNNCNPEDEDIFNDDKFIFYAKRPMGLQNMCFADFCCTVNRYKRGTRSPNATNIIAQDEDYIFCSRNRSKILSYVCPVKDQDPEGYYRINFLLFLPWRVENEIASNYVTYFECFKELNEEQRSMLKENAQKYNKENIHHLLDLMETVQSDMRTLGLQADERNESDQRKPSTSMSDVDFFKPPKSSDNRSNDMQVHDNTAQTTANSAVVERMWSNSTYMSQYNMLNSQQRRIVDHIMTHVTSNREPLRTFVTGGAGTGKTKVLKTIYQGLSRHYNLRRGSNTSMKSVICLAFTGKAAYLINGETVHRALHIRMQNSYCHYETLSADKMNSVRFELKDLNVLLLDEISLIGNKFFNFINLRLQDIKCCKETFGGIHVILFGDLFQLPPVKDSWIFQDLSFGSTSIGTNLWRSEFKMFELTEIMRQKEDQQFANLLNRIRECRHTQQDIAFIRRNTQMQPSIETTISSDTLYLCPTNKQVDEINASSYNLSAGHKVTVCAYDKLIGTFNEVERAKYLEECAKSSENMSTLLHKLELATGLVYDIVYNVNVADGLANGCCGILKYIEFVDIENFRDKPAILWLKFEDDLIGRSQREVYKNLYSDRVDPSWTPLMTITNHFTIKRSTISVYRTQFPIKLATAKTVHKSQGSTVSKVVVNLTGSKNKAHLRHSAYVALSRVTSLSGLTTVNFDDSQIVPDSSVKEEMTRLRNQSLLQLSCYDTIDHDRYLCVYYNNVQFINKSSASLLADPRFQISDIQLFNETHLRPYDTVPSCLDNNINHCRVDVQISRILSCKSGLAIQWRQPIILTDLYRYGQHNCEFLLAELSLNNIQGVVGVFYCQTNASHPFIAHMFEWVRTALPTQHIICIAGDLNQDAATNKKLITKIKDILNCETIGLSPTTRAGTTIDFMFTQRKTVQGEATYVPWSHHFSSVLLFDQLKL